jgi:hypothetical protein
VTFLNHLMLWGLLAASVPIIIHLLNRRRHKTIQWAAMQFLLKATRESRGKKKLRHFLILACRTLGIATLVFAAARPIVSGLLGWGGGSIDLVVLVLDRSASMEARSGDGQPPRRQLVLEQVRDSMKSLGTARLVLIDSATGNPQDIPSPEVLAELSTTAATDTEADFPVLLNRAAEFLQNTPGRAEIWLASDLQAANWHPDDERWAAARASLANLPQRPAVRVISVGGAAAPNTAISVLGSRRAGDDLLLDVELLRTTENRGSVNIPLTANLNGTRTTDSLTIPGQSFKFQKRITLPPGSESGYGWLSIPADGNDRDNAAFFAYGPARSVRTAVVSAPGEAAGYLMLAAAPPEFGKLQAELTDPARMVALKTADISTLLWAAPLPTGAAADALTRFVSGGGQVVFLPHGGAPAESFMDFNWEPVKLADKDKYFISKEWNHTDGPLRDGLNGTPVPVDRLKAIRRQIPTGNAAVIARWEDGEALLTRHIIDRGTVWFLGTTPDYAWSNLGDGDVLLPLIQRIVALGSERFDSAYVAAVGSDSSKSLPGEVRTRLDDFGSPDPANISHLGGVFKLGDRLIALNRPAAEDSPEILNREGLNTALAGTNYTLLAQAGQADDPSLSRDVWRVFLIAMIFFLLAEAILCLPSKTTVKVLEEALSTKH